MKRFKIMALAALVAFAACDEGTDVVVTPDVTGDITGTVTIEGAAVSGVTVELSSGATTVTDGSGSYTFTGVAAGAYTITITNFASDATFSSTSKAATIVSTDQVATVNFDGVYVRTSAILGTVSVGNLNLAGVSVSIGSSTMQTDASGAYSFAGLRAGTYTVTVSGFSASQYAFAPSTQDVTVGVGESKVVSFNGQLLANATIVGTLYIDGNGNDSMDPGEPPVATAGILVGLEYAIGEDTIWTTTDANGSFAFADQPEGSYKVICCIKGGFPGAFSQSGSVRQTIGAGSGISTPANFAFTVTTQYVNVYGMLGIDAVNVGVAPIKNWSITLYPTELDAAAGTFPITTVSNKTAIKTDANGLSSFSFLRANDYSPNANVVDGIVFAKVGGPGPAGAPSATHQMSGESIIEIPWLPMDSMVMAPDTFDAVYNTVTVKIRALEIDGDSLNAWTAQFWSGTDTLTAVLQPVTQTVASGYASFTINGSLIGYPTTGYFRLAPAAVQTGDGGHGWTQTPIAEEGDANGSFLKIEWDGTVGPSDAIMAGVQSVKYTDSDVVVYAHRELDDTLGYTLGDNLGFGGSGLNIDLRKVTSGGTSSLAGSPINMPSFGTGMVTFLNVPVKDSYQLRARPASANYVVLNDTSMAMTLDGSDQVYTHNALGGTGAHKISSFMAKTDNNTLTGNVMSRYGITPVAGLVVTVTPAANNIQGSTSAMVGVVATTGAGGAFTIDSLREGPYEVTVAAGDSAYTFLRTLKKTLSPAWSTINSDGIAAATNNDSPTMGTRDLQGFANSKVVNFEAYRNDVEFSGLVVNDRDTDLTTIDPGEALTGAVLNLYRDDDGSATAGTDTLTATATTDAGGVYSFTGLVEGRYTAVWSVGTPASDTDVLAAISSTNVKTQKITATSTMSFQVKNTSAQLPSWDYAASAIPAAGSAQANFTFLYNNTEVRGTATTGGAAVVGMTVTLQRCYNPTLGALTLVSGPKPEGLAGVTCGGSYFTGQQSTTTDASGIFSFKGLAEGVYRVTLAPSSVGLANWTAAGGTANASEPGIYLTSGSGDIETMAYTLF